MLGGVSFEAFMKISQGLKDVDLAKGAQAHLFRNLVAAENGDASVKHLPPASEQFATVQRHMIRGLKLCFNIVKSYDEAEEIKRALILTEGAADSHGLMAALDVAMDVMRAYK